MSNILLIESQVGSHPDLKNIDFQFIKEQRGALSYLNNQSDELDIVIIGETHPSPIRFAQEIYQLFPHLTLIILCQSSQFSSLKQTLLFSPFLGSETRILNLEHIADLPQMIQDCLEVLNQKKKFQSLQASAQLSLFKATQNQNPQSEIVKLDKLLEHAPFGVVVLDKNIEVKGWNHQASQLLNTSKNKALNSSFLQFFQIHETDRISQLVLNALSYQEQSTPELFCRTHLEKQQFLELSVIKIPGESSNLYAMIVFQDVTDRVESEEIRKESDYVRSIIEASMDSLMLINPNGLITDLNQATEALTKCSRKQMIGSKYATYFTEPEKARDFCQQVLREEKITDFPLTIKQSPKTIPVLNNASVYRNETGDIKGVLITARDITKQKEIETHLLKAKETAEQASQAKSDFLANMSHELRTPLNAILGYSALIAEDIQDQCYESLLEDLDKIKQSGHHLLNLVNQVLDLSRIESNTLNIKAERFNLIDLLNEVNSSILPQARANQNHFTFKYSNQDLILSTDLTRLKQVLLNLLSNACKFTHNGKISLNVDEKVHADQIGVIFEIQDTGVGISKENQSKIFNKFFQIDTSSTRKHSGMGLGLAISREFIQGMGGHISVESQPNKGARFTFWIPSQIKTV